MAYTEPTVETFKTRFPRFAAVADATIQLLLDLAIARVDDSWIEADRAEAQMQLTAHMYVSEAATTAMDGAGAIQSESFGPISTSYAVGAAAKGSFSGTGYGREYSRLARLSFPAVKVAGC